MKIKLTFKEETHLFDTVAEAAKALKCSKPAIYIAIKRGYIRGWEITAVNLPQKLYI